MIFPSAAGGLAFLTLACFDLVVYMHEDLRPTYRDVCWCFPFFSFYPQSRYWLSKCQIPIKNKTSRKASHFRVSCTLHARLLSSPTWKMTSNDSHESPRSANSVAIKQVNVWEKTIENHDMTCSQVRNPLCMYSTYSDEPSDATWAALKHTTFLLWKNFHRRKTKFKVRLDDKVIPGIS